MKSFFKSFSIIFTLTFFLFIIFDLIIGKIYKNELKNFDKGAHRGVSTFFSRIIGDQPPCDPNIYPFLANEMGCVGKNINNSERHDNIVVIGGSTVFAGFPPFHEELDKRLKINNYKKDVYNFGIIGSYTVEDMLRYLFKISQYEHDIAIFYGPMNDIHGYYSYNTEMNMPHYLASFNYFVEKINEKKWYDFFLKGTNTGKLFDKNIKIKFFDKFTEPATVYEELKKRNKIWGTKVYFDEVATAILGNIKIASHYAPKDVKVVFINQPHLCYYGDYDKIVDDSWRWPGFCRFLKGINNSINRLVNEERYSDIYYLDMTNVYSKYICNTKECFEKKARHRFETNCEKLKCFSNIIDIKKFKEFDFTIEDEQKILEKYKDQEGEASRGILRTFIGTNENLDGLYPVFVDGLHTQQFAKNILGYEIFKYLEKNNIL